MRVVPHGRANARRWDTIDGDEAARSARDVYAVGGWPSVVRTHPAMGDQ